MRLFEIMIPDNVSLEATGDAARLAIKRAGARGREFLAGGVAPAPQLEAFRQKKKSFLTTVL